jgi:hypothetical protein
MLFGMAALLIAKQRLSELTLKVRPGMAHKAKYGKVEDRNSPTWPGTVPGLSHSVQFIPKSCTSMSQLNNSLKRLAIPQSLGA